MPLSWNEIKNRAPAFSRDWTDASEERAQVQGFWVEFFNIFGGSSRRVASLEEPVRKLGERRGFIDLFREDTRSKFPEASLADLHNRLTMTPPLIKARQALVRTLDAAYVPSGGKRNWTSDAGRLAFPFTLYQRLTSLPSAAASAKPARRRRPQPRGAE